MASCVRVVSATAAVWCGVNVPDVETVIHVGLSYALLACAQEFGRSIKKAKLSRRIIFTTRQTTGQEEALRTAINTGSEESD